MKVTVDMIRNNVVLIELDGRLDLAGTQLAEAQFNAAASAGRNAIVSLARVPFIASVGIRMLMGGARTQSRMGGKLVLMAPDEISLKILKTTGIDQLVPVRADLDAALAEFA